MEATTLISILRPLIELSQPEWKKNKKALAQRFADETSQAVAAHHVAVSRWSQDAHGIVLGGTEANAPTIDLIFRTIPRKVGLGGREIDELDVLGSRGHVAVLGDPGAGKTTTLRRLSHYVAHEAEVSTADDHKFVVLVVCREQSWTNDGLYPVLGDKIGVGRKLYADIDNPKARIREVIDIGALVIVDGLDEVPSRYRAALESDLVDLGRHLTNAKIIVSCRSGDYVKSLDGFETAEIQPLGETQIGRVVTDILGPVDAKSFHRAVNARNHPAADLMNRPLFLLQMLAIYRRRGTIPERPIDLYESLIRLVIQEWDEQRGVRRVSKYGQFGVDDKRRFLADLAYELIHGDSLAFSEGELVRLYPRLAERYGLPSGQARMVARELESHNGLIVESGENYEFSHLSLQEFLAADAMIRGGTKAQKNWWIAYPSVAAVAVAMSSDANAWFNELVRQLPRNLQPIRSISPFLRRLGQESPRFIRSTTLGSDLVFVASRSYLEDLEAIEGLSQIRAVRDSVADELMTWHNFSIKPDKLRLVRYGGYQKRITEDILEVSTPIIVALIGEESLHHIARVARSDLKEALERRW